MKLARPRTRALLGAAVLFGAGWLWLHVVPVPAFAAVRDGFVPSQAVLLDRHGAVLDVRRIALDLNRSAWVPLGQVSPAMTQAVIEAEDRRYFDHHGVDWLGALGALRDDLLHHRHRGASTITMQLALLLDAQGNGRAGPAANPRGAPRSVRRKLHQSVMALALETRWTKAEILEAYLNLLPYRGDIEGIGAAAALLAHKAPAALTDAESRVLAALLPAPAAGVRQVALRGCARRGLAAQSAECSALRGTAAAMLARGAGAVDDERLAPQLAGALLTRPGEALVTTLDASLQRLVRDTLARQLAGLAGHNVRDGAALVVDNASGEILAYVGSAGPLSRSREVDGVRARRQAGSTLKPFLYELAIERGLLTAASVLDDSPLNLDTATGTYLPQDYDHAFKGLVSVRTALGSSLNVPAVRALVLVGVEPFRDRLHALGYQGLTEDGAYYGYSLALGSAEVSLWEQAEAYRTLARGGRAGALHLRGAPSTGTERALLAEPASFVVADMLSDRAARIATFGLDNALNTPYWSAVKTGTSKDMRDNWCIGFSARYTVAVWVGNFEGDPMHEVSGITGAAPVWREILDALQDGGGAGVPAPPRGVELVETRFTSGLESPRRELYVEGTAPAASIDTVGAGVAVPHITSPANGMVIALDPDIPASHQRVAIRTEGGGRGLIVRLNGTSLGEAGQPLLWAPSRGAQRLALEDRAGHTLDRILFTVR